jgi:asparagine synthase (glutamine-hydrolysing)
MCGINAIFAYDSNAPSVSQEELLTVRDAMIARGPDGAGLWLSSDKRVGLGHRRLAIIDIIGGVQPMTIADNNKGAMTPVICFNGEIYNYRELRDELLLEGHKFQTTSDTEVLLHLYNRDGPEMVQHLRGMFAFVLWDPVRRGMLLARDPFGIKPLYYADDGKTLRVASQVKALLKVRHNIDTSPEPAGHVGFFLFGYVPEPYTLYQGICALPAGSSLWIDKKGNRQLNHFFNLTQELAKYSSSFTLQQQLHTSLSDSVRQHLVADVPVGIFLSAGLDSTTIVALAQENSQAKLNTVTLGFNEYRGRLEDETVLAEQVARHLHTHHQTCWVKAHDFASNYQSLLTAMDQPSTDGVNTYFVAKVTAETGLKVALSGVGGDELFGGYPSFRGIPRLVQALTPFRFFPYLGRGFRKLTVAAATRLTSPKYAGILEYGTRYGDAYLLRRGLFMPWELPKILDPELVKEGWQTLQPTLRLEQTIEGLVTARQKVAALELSWYMRNQLLRDADWAGMAHSLEIRTPLVDIKLFRSLTSLLASAQPPTKQDMASTPNTALPKTVLQRTKTGFSVPTREWILQENPSIRNERGLRGWARVIYDNFW